tara:strand:+ start:388 stop:723 length:336 start_codon:yes stop_codon:yes gene_type:complete
MSNKPSIWERRRAIELEVIKEKMLKANKARTDLLSDNPEINSKWTPNAISIMAEKNDCVHTQLHEAQDHLIDFTEDSEYKRLYKQQSELIENWVEEEEKRLPPKPPMTPFG